MQTKSKSKSNQILQLNIKFKNYGRYLLIKHQCGLNLLLIYKMMLPLKISDKRFQKALIVLSILKDLQLIVWEPTKEK